MGRVAFQKVGNTDAECKSALVNKGERKIDGRGLIGNVLRFGQLRFLRHLSSGETVNLTHFANSLSHLLYFVGKMLFLHSDVLLVLKK